MSAFARLAILSVKESDLRPASRPLRYPLFSFLFGRDKQTNDNAPEQPEASATAPGAPALGPGEHGR